MGSTLNDFGLYSTALTTNSRHFESDSRVQRKCKVLVIKYEASVKFLRITLETTKNSIKILSEKLEREEVLFCYKLLFVHF